MAQLTMDTSFAGDLLRVALDPGSGRLRQYGLLAETLRGALLTDLAALGRLQRADAETDVDTTSTGLAVADEFLDDIVTHPTRTMERWLRLGGPHPHEIIAELIADGCWRIERHGLTPTHARYIDRDASRYTALRAELCSIVSDGHAARTERLAALATLAACSALLGAEHFTDIARPALLAQCGTLTWIVRDVCEYLHDARADDAAAGVANAVSFGLQAGSI